MGTADSDQRRAALAREVTSLVSGGRRIETHDAFQAIVTHGRLVERRELLQVDETGNVTREVLPIDRERILVLIGLAVVAVAFIVYLLVTAATGSGDPAGGPPPT